MVRKMRKLLFSGTIKTANQTAPAIMTDSVDMVSLIKCDFKESLYLFITQKTADSRIVRYINPTPLVTGNVVAVNHTVL